MRGKEIDLGLLFLRLGVGCILIYFGCQKMVGMFGGQGFSHQIETFQKLGFPALLATLSIFAEFFGSLGLILGFFTRIAAFGVSCNMAVATWFVLKTPGAMDNIFKYGTPNEVGKIFFPLLLLFGALALLCTGAGRFSIDSKLFPAGGSKKKK